MVDASEHKIQPIEQNVWYSFHRSEYKGKAPWFYNPSEFEWVDNIHSEFLSIKKEITRLLGENEDQVVPYFNKDIVADGAVWKTMFFYFWGTRNDKLMEQSPLLEKVFSQIPGFMSAALSKLEAHSEIKWHPGDTSGVIRCHLPMKVPAGLPSCGFQVKEETKAWVEGEMLMFCDAYKHRAFNDTDEDRVVLIIDVLHPQFVEKRRSIRANVLSILWTQKVLSRSPWLKFTASLVRLCCRAYAYIYVSFVRK